MALAESGSPSAHKPIDVETAFAAGFPAVADEHQVADGELYAALVDDDVVTYAAWIDAGIGRRIDELAARAIR